MRQFRALFISDVHLGARGCQADRCCSTSCATTMPTRSTSSATSSTAGSCARAGTGRSRTTTWCRSCCARRARAPASIYVPGNHDEFLRDYYGTHFGGIEVCERAIHDGADGRRYLVIHGDHFDLVVTQARWLALLGDKAYDLRDRRQPPVQRRAPPARLRLLVAVAMGEAEGQERRQLHRRVREDAGRRRRSATTPTA